MVNFCAIQNHDNKHIRTELVIDWLKEYEAKWETTPVLEGEADMERLKEG
jgi:hypothetical protein